MSSTVPDTKLTQSICAIVLKGKWNDILRQKIGTKITSTVINQVLNQLSLFGCGHSLSWALFKWVESLPTYNHSLQSSWTMVHILAKHKHFKTAHQLLEKIAQRDFMSSPLVLKSLMSSDDGGCDTEDPDVSCHVLSWLLIFYAKSRMTHDAIQVFEQMRVCSFKPHLHACTVLLNSLVKDRLTDTVWKIYKKMVVLGVVANLHVYNVLVHACCKSGDVEKVEKLLSEMEMKGVSPDLFTYNTLIALYCKKGMHYEALSVQDIMERSGVNPDIVTYNSLMYGFCREGRMREAVRLFRDIKNATPNHVTYTTLIDGYCRVNDLEEALRLREVMEAKRLSLGVVTYNSILRKLCEEGRIRDANKLLHEMSERNIEPDNITCNTLINAYSKIGDMRSAVKVKDKMVESGLKLDPFTYKALIHGFCKAQETENAKEHLFLMLNSGFPPSYCSYYWIIDCYSNQFKEEEIMQIPDEFERRGVCIDLSMFRALIRGFCKIEKVDYAERVYSLMKSKNIEGDSLLHANLALAYWKLGKVSEASKYLDEMSDRKLIIGLKVYRCLNGSCTDENKAVSFFWSHVVDRGLMAKSILKEMHQKNLQS